MNISFTDKFYSDHVYPQMAREKVALLDGEWTCNGKHIIVPYAPEAELSEYEGREALIASYASNEAKIISEENGTFIYERDFVIPDGFDRSRVLLHFDAVDQIAEVYVNDRFVGKHEGGYLAFKFDITEFLNEKGKSNRLRVKAVDTLSHVYPYGKQRIDRGGMWYTPVSGIWKSVWLENVPDVYIDRVEYRVKETENEQTEAETAGVNSKMLSVIIKVFLSDGRVLDKELSAADLPEYKLWTTDSPYLYKIKLEEGEDSLFSYFALRTVDIREINGIQRVCLNGIPIFMHGVLDQAYWPDGLYTPKDKIEHDRDIERMKKLGFNMLRVHCKVETQYFYTACDRLGILVCQDMVESGGYHYVRDTVMPTIGFKKRKERPAKRGLGVQKERGSEWMDAYDDDVRQDFFIEHCKATIKEVQSHPSIIMYTIFNEGWGQFASSSAYDILKPCDPDRLFDSTSGWFAGRHSDFDTEHIYFRLKKLKPRKKPMFLKECGGYSLDMKALNAAKAGTGDLADAKAAETGKKDDSNYGYGACGSKEMLTFKIRKLYQVMVFPAIEKGLCGCIYTQVSDIEDEINGMYTYDRSECKVVPNEMLKNAGMIDIMMREYVLK